jgi:peptide/nickel transport system substrate-binding protein
MTGWLSRWVLGVVVLLAVSAAPAGAADTPVRGGRVIVALSQDLQTLNPHLVITGTVKQVTYNLFDSLWYYDPAGILVPNLAVEIPTPHNGGISADGLTYTFRVRKGVKWHDGKPFTATDVKFTWELIMSPKFRAVTRAGLTLIKSMAATDDATIKVELTEPYAPFLGVWAEIPILPQHVLGQAPDPNVADFNTKSPIGTGPFKFVEWRKGDHITLEAYRGYHGPGPYLDQLIFKIVPDLNAMFAQYRAGEIDVTGSIPGLPLELYEEAKRVPGTRVIVDENNYLEMVYLNHMKPWFGDNRVRRALYLAVDRKAILDRILLGLVKPADGYVHPSSWAYAPGLIAHRHDPAEAERLLDAAGWRRGADGVRQKDGVRMSFDFATVVGDKTREQIQQVVQQQWQRIGVDANIKNRAGAALWGPYYQKSEFDVLLLSFLINPDPEMSTRFHSGSIAVKTGKGANYMGYSNPEFDRLLDLGARTFDAAKRKETYKKIQELWVKDLPALPLYWKVSIEGVKASLQGYKTNPNVYNNTWNAREWWLKP